MIDFEIIKPEVPEEVREITLAVIQQNERILHMNQKIIEVLLARPMVRLRGDADE